MMDPFSVVFITLGALGAAYTIHENLESLSILPEELRSLSDECSRLEDTLRAIGTIQLELVQEGRASSSKVDRSAIVPNVDGALADATKRLSDLKSFISYMSKKVKENDKGDHWQWIKKKNNIDKLRANLQSIRYDLTVRCSNACPEYFDKELFIVQQTGKEAIQSTPQAGETSRLHRAKTDDRLASHVTEYQQADCMSAYPQTPQVQAIEAPNHWESEPCPIAREQSSFWPGPFHCLCIERRLPSSLAIPQWLRRICSSMRTCYILVTLGVFSIASSLALALWRTINYEDIQGGFSVAQYILAVTALVIGCVLVLHSRTCSCWSSSSSKGGNGPAPEDMPIELQPPG